MNDINMPGFTADASLYKTSRQDRMTTAPAQAGAIQPQAPFIGEWMARADSVAAFYGGGSFHTSSLADIAERRMCLALARSCRSRNMAACQRMRDDCPVP
jgi:hypothetical protein